MDLHEEKKLVAQAQKDPIFFGVLFEAQYQKIFGYVLRRVGAVEATQDIVAEVFCKALKKLWQFRWQGIPFSAWLYRIATNEINQYFRKGARHPSVSLDTLMEEGYDAVGERDLKQEIEEAEQVLERHQEFLRVHKEILKLSPKYQEVIVLRFFEEKKTIEIARILGKSEGTIKSLLSRGLDKLCAAMDTETDATQPFSLKRIVESERSMQVSTPKKHL